MFRNANAALPRRIGIAALALQSGRCASLEVAMDPATTSPGSAPDDDPLAAASAACDGAERLFHEYRHVEAEAASRRAAALLVNFAGAMNAY